MMQHAERFAFAREFSAHMAAEHRLLVGGVYGSTARGEDTPYSDLEMFFVLQDGSPTASRHFLFRGTAVGYRAYQERDLLQILTRPDGRWPFHMGLLDALQVLEGDPERVARWLEQGRATPAARFHAYLEAHLPEWVVESYGRVHSSALRKDWPTTRYALQEVLFEMLTVLCLLNKSWVHRDYDAGLLEAAGFEQLPAGYASLVPQLLAAVDFDELLAAVDALVGGFRALLATAGITVPDYDSVEEIPL